MKIENTELREKLKEDESNLSYYKSQNHKLVTQTNRPKEVLEKELEIVHKELTKCQKELAILRESAEMDLHERLKAKENQLKMRDREIEDMRIELNTLQKIRQENEKKMDKIEKERKNDVFP